MRHARRWFHTPRGEPVHADLVRDAAAIEAQHQTMVTADLIHERIYRARGMLAGQTATLRALGVHGYTLARLNVTKSVVDTAVSKLGKDRPMPQVVLDDADWAIKRRGRLFTRFLRATMRETDFDEQTRAALRDGALRGTGVLKVVPGAEEIAVDVVPREEILVDARDGRYRKPRMLVHRKLVPRDVLAAMFPKHRAEIMAAASGTRRWEDVYDEYGTTHHGEEDRVACYEAWHLPSGPDARDGRHALVIENATLTHEAWTRQRFPFAFWHWSPPIRGFWGCGLVEEVAPLQEAINNVVRDIQRNIEFAGRLAVAVRRGSGVTRSHLTGRQPYVIEYDGPQPPQFFVPTAISPAQLQYLAKLEQAAYDLTGVSMMSAQSRNPLGANASGRALDNFYDIQSERFAEQQADYAIFRLTASELLLDAAYDLAEDAKKRKRTYTAVWLDRGHAERIDWEAIETDRGGLRLALEPVSFVPDTRAGKLAAVEQLAEAGIIDTDMAASLFDEPDIERANRLRNAAYNNLERIMEQLADVEVNLGDLTPEPYHDMRLAAQMCVAYYNRAQSDEAPEEVLERYRWFLRILEAEQATEQPAPEQAPQPGAEMPPEAMAGMLPPGMEQMIGAEGLPPEMAGAPGAMPPADMMPPVM